MKVTKALVHFRHNRSYAHVPEGEATDIGEFVVITRDDSKVDFSQALSAAVPGRIVSVVSTEDLTAPVAFAIQ